MLKTNCIFRNPIKALLKELKSFNQKRKDLEDYWVTTTVMMMQRRKSRRSSYRRRTMKRRTKISRR